MNILVLSGSARKGSNRDLMVNGFVNATAELQNVEVISVAAPCASYNACYFILMCV
jgi:multimeric flavodoxin WrbA